jgi:hypothetical protein
VALAARSLRHRRRLDHLLVDDDPRRHLAAAPPLLLLGRLRRLGRFVHAARFDARAALQPFQTGDLFARLADTLFQGGNFAAQLAQQSFQLWTAQIGEERARRHVRKDAYPIEPGQAKNTAPPGVLPLLRKIFTNPNYG